METVFFYLQLFFCLRKPLLSLNSVSTKKIRISFKNNFPLDGKKTTVPRKKEKKIVSTSWKTSCPLARISSFFENCFPLIPRMASTAKNSSDQNTVSTRQNIGFQRNPLFRLVETDFLASGNVFFCAEFLL